MCCNFLKPRSRSLSLRSYCGQHTQKTEDSSYKSKAGASFFYSFGIITRVHFKFTSGSSLLPVQLYFRLVLLFLVLHEQKNKASGNENSDVWTISCTEHAHYLFKEILR
jgi:hypothetical protein